MSITPEDRREAKDLLIRAARLAQKHGIALTEDAESPREALVALAIMFSSMGAAAGCTLHQLMGLLMETHKQTLRMEGDE